LTRLQAATDPLYRSGLVRALEIIKQIDPDADPGEVEPGVKYGPSY
jgi:hypothetical protein